MNKKRIDKNIDLAYKVMSKVGIAVDGRVSRSYRGQIASFGAAISSGSLIAAIAFFSGQNKAQVDRSKLMRAIMELIKLSRPEMDFSEYEKDENTALFFFVQQHKEDRLKLKEEIIDYAIAIKLAMNLYELTTDH